MYNGIEIKFENQYVYLGVPFVQSGTFDAITKLFMSKSKKAIQPVLKIINNLNYVNLNTCNKLCDALVKSILLYAAPIWSPRHLKDMEKIQNAFYKKLLFLPQNTPGYAIRLETGVERMEIKIFKIILNYIHKKF